MTQSNGVCHQCHEMVLLPAVNTRTITRKHAPRRVRLMGHTSNLSALLTSSLTDLLNAMKSKIPIFAPNQQSTYSNVAFELLGIVIERVTGQTYRSYIEEAIFKPLNMSKSSLSLPPDEAGVIPSGQNYWDVEEGIQSPTGAIYSSSTDLSKYLRYILTHFNGITHALSWFNPASSARGLNTFTEFPGRSSRPIAY